MTDSDELHQLLQRALGADYEVLRPLGQGGAGVVFLTSDLRLKRLLAIKVLSPRIVHSSGAVERFANESEAIARVTHPNVVPVHFVGRTGDLLYIAMQYVDGGTLAQRIERHGSLPVADVLRITREVASGLSQAHQRGIIHRDIKPQNILIDAESDRCLIADFGIARVDDATLTATGVVSGTPMYLAPEQVVGESLDRRVDIYALGLLLYEMLRGERPFDAPTPMAAMLMRLAQDPPPIREFRPDVPEWLAVILAKCLAREPAERFQDVPSLISALDRGEMEGVVPRSRARDRGKRRWALAIGMMAVVAIGVTAMISRRPTTKAGLLAGATGAMPADGSDGALSLARAAYHAGELERSIEQFRSIAANTDLDASRRKEAYRYLARAYLALGKEANAKASLNEMLSLTPPIALLIPSRESEALMRLYQDVLVQRSIAGGDGGEVAPITAIAVYPFQQVTSDTAWAGFGTGIGEILTTHFRNRNEVKAVDILDRAVLDVYDGGDSVAYSVEDVTKAGIEGQTDQFGRKVKLIRASHLIFGSFSVRGNDLLLTAWLVDVNTGNVSGGTQVLGTPDKAFHAVERLADRVVAVVRARVQH